MEVTVYVVTSGSYSDYRIERVFSDKEAAERYANVRNEHGGDDFRVEEYDVDAVMPRVEIEYHVIIDATGEEIRRGSDAKVEPTLEEMADRSDTWNWGDGDKFSGASCRGYDVALKIARDKLAEHKARAEGV